MLCREGAREIGLGETGMVSQLAQSLSEPDLGGCGRYGHAHS